MNKWIFGTILMCVVAACSTNGFKKGENGLEYRFIVENSQNRQPQYNEIVEISMCYTTEKDSVLYDTRETGNVFRLKIKDESTTKGTINDALLMMHEGDSAIFKVNAERFFTETKGEDVPSFIKPGSKLIFHVKLYTVFDMKKYLESKRKSSNANESEEMEQLKTYLSISNITVNPTLSGMYYVETKKGTGKKPDHNSTVKIDYMVSFVNGEIFDNTYQRNEPFEFQLGKNLVIPGLEEGVKYMNEGGEATLIIPSKLAYGSKQYKAVPPFSSLVFEIKLINVKNE